MLSLTDDNPAEFRREGWIVTALAALLAALTRLIGLAHPHKLIFDETYYVKGAYSLITKGYEAQWDGETANKLFEHGDFSALGSKEDYVVHPPLGKEIIGAGMRIFGPESSYGWRFAVAICGIISVALVVRCALIIFRSVMLAGVAGLLMSVDGMGITMSRIGILDNILAMFVLIGFWAILRDREWVRRRLATAVAYGPLRPPEWEESGAGIRFVAPAAPRARTLDDAGLSGNEALASDFIDDGAAARSATTAGAKGKANAVTPMPASVPVAKSEPTQTLDPWGPRILWRPWVLVAGVALGCACGVKWSGIYAIAVFGLTIFFWGMLARKAAGVPLWMGAGVFREGAVAFVHLVPTAFVTYLLCWLPWFTNMHSWGRRWAADARAAGNPLPHDWLPDALQSLLAYHERMYAFHTGLHSPHRYQSQPWEWIVQGRPVSFYWVSEADSTHQCGSHKCIEAITSIGNPLLWWLAAIALILVVFGAVVHRDWRAWAILSGYLGLYAPWFQYLDRTIYQFYAIAFLPYVVLALTYGIGVMSRTMSYRDTLRPRLDIRSRRLLALLTGKKAGNDEAACVAAEAPEAAATLETAEAAAMPEAADATAAPEATEPLEADVAAPAESPETDPADGVVNNLPEHGDCAEGETRAPVKPSLWKRAFAPAVYADGAEVNGNADIRGKWRFVVPGVLIVIVVASVFWYPIWVGMPVPKWFWQMHMWFPWWI